MTLKDYYIMIRDATAARAKAVTILAAIGLGTPDEEIHVASLVGMDLALLLMMAPMLSCIFGSLVMIFIDDKLILYPPGA